jgi:hypothetical protein
VSWDIFVMDLPAVPRVEDIPDDWDGQPLGSRDDVIATIRDAVPDVDFTDPGWGLIDGGSYSIEVSIGREDPVVSFALHVRGGGDAAAVVSRVLRRGRWRGLDSQTGEFFSDNNAADTLGEWQRYRDAVIRRGRETWIDPPGL